jgi:hypothetical protein
MRLGFLKSPIVTLVILALVIATSAPTIVQAIDTLVDGNIVFSDPGQNTARDIRSTDNKGGIRVYNSETTGLANPPTGAAIQFYGNDHTGFPGQAYIDTGSHNNAAIIFRAQPAGVGVTERMRIDAQGRLIVGNSSNPACNSAGDLCVAGDLVVDGAVNIVGNGVVKAGVVAECGNAASSITRQFNTVNATTITVANGTLLGECVIDFGFDITNRYIVATGQQTATGLIAPTVSIAAISGETVTIDRNVIGLLGALLGENGTIHVQVF